MRTLEQLAVLTDSSFSGNKDTKIHSVADLKEASEGQISFVNNNKYLKHLETCNASAVIVTHEIAKSFKGNILINENPYMAVAHVIEILHAEPKPKAVIHKSASIDESAVVHESASIGPNVVIDEKVEIQAGVIVEAGCFIGKNSILKKGIHLYPNVTVYKDTIIGENTIVHAAATLGADGFGFAPTPEKQWFKILQIGNLIIGDDVEVGANTTIDRATLGSTKINNGVKLDNHIHIGHNVTIGEHTVMAAGTVVGGSTSIGKRCQIGGASALSGHIVIADDVILTGRSMVTNSVKLAGVYSSGIALDENKKWRKNAARFRKLDDLAKKVKNLEKKLNEK